MASLGKAAREYLGAGWPVLPGAYWSPQTCTYRCGRPGCDNGSPHPVDGGGPGRCSPRLRPLSLTADEVDRWWSDRGFNLILPTGAAVATVVEGPVRFVAALEARLAEAGCPPAPVLALPTGERQLFSAPIPVDDELWLATAVGGATLHGDGGWVTLPPSIVSTGKIRWERAPEALGWRLPPALAVRTALRAVLDPGRAAA